MKIAHLKLTTFVPTKTGFDRRVGYVTIACRISCNSAVDDGKLVFPCNVSVSFCQPGEVFKKKHGSSAVNARMERSKSFGVLANKSNWLQKSILGFCETDPSWVRDAVNMWFRGLNYNFGNVVVEPITFLNGDKLRK